MYVIVSPKAILSAIHDWIQHDRQVDAEDYIYHQYHDYQMARFSRRYGYYSILTVSPLSRIGDFK